MSGSIDPAFVLLEELFEKRLVNLTRDTRNMSINNDIFFLLTMSIIVFLMQCGFAFLEAGTVRSKNVTNILIKNLLDSCFSAMAYWAFGWAFAYGQPGNTFIGYGQFFGSHMPASKYHVWFFQFVFAAAASTIVSGAVAERCEFVAYVAYCLLLTGFVYPVVSHWAWDTHKDSTGWLKKLGYTDFAGSGVVHLVGGISGLMGAIFLGPRLGRFSKKGLPVVAIRGHSVPFVALGGFILIGGFFAFNGGSQASISQEGDGEVVSRAMVNTMLSGAAAALFTLVACKFKLKTWSLLSTLNGALAGMVSVCAGCDAYEPYAAVVVGILGGASYLFWSWTMLQLRIDDPLDAFAVHAGGGLWGVLAVPFLHNSKGILYSFNGDIRISFELLGWNICGAGVIILWSGLFSGVLFATLRYLGKLRVSRDVEIRGLDIFKHAEPSYPTIAYGHGWGPPWDSVMDWLALASETQRRISLDRARELLSNGVQPSIPRSHSDSNVSRLPRDPGDSEYGMVRHSGTKGLPKARQFSIQEVSSYFPAEAHPYAYDGPASINNL